MNVNNNLPKMDNDETISVIAVEIIFFKEFIYLVK